MHALVTLSRPRSHIFSHDPTFSHSHIFACFQILKTSRVVTSSQIRAFPRTHVPKLWHDPSPQYFYRRRSWSETSLPCWRLTRFSQGATSHHVMSFTSAHSAKLSMRTTINHGCTHASKPWPATSFHNELHSEHYVWLGFVGHLVCVCSDEAIPAFWTWAMEVCCGVWCNVSFLAVAVVEKKASWTWERCWA